MVYGITRKARPEVLPVTQDQEFAGSLQSFMDELEKSNLELIQTVQRLQHDLETEIQTNRRRIEAVEQELRRVQEESLQQLRSPGTDSAFALSGPYADALRLSREGLSVEQIARKLGMGVGEIEFALRLSREGGTQ